MDNNTKWLIAVDLDGTVINSKDNWKELHVSDYAKSVFKTLVDQGHKVAIITGRPWNDYKPVYTEIYSNTLTGCYNGAVLYDPVNEKQIETYTISKESIKSIVEDERVFKSFRTLVIEGDNSSTRIISRERDNETRSIKNFRNEGVISEFNDDNTEEFYEDGLSLYIEFYKTTATEDIVNEVLKELKENNKDHLNLIKWDFPECTVVEIKNSNSHKGNALEFIAKYEGIPMTNTIAFGDNLNDLEMLATAHQGYAVKSGRDEVKESTDFVTELGVEDDGVPKELVKKFKLDIK